MWILNRHYNEALDDYYGKLGRYGRIAGTRADVTKQLEAMRLKETRKNFLRGPTAPLAAAETSEAIRAIVERNGATLITMQPPTTKDDGRYRAVTVNVQMTANIIALRSILHAIETNVPYLFVDTLSVRSQVPGNYKPVPGGEQDLRAYAQAVFKTKQDFRKAAAEPDSARRAEARAETIEGEAK